MERIGFICDIRETSKPMKVVGFARLQRAIPMAHVLREAGIELFAYSPRHINPRTRMAFGYIIGAQGFIPIVAPVPRVNGNWFLGNYKSRDRSGMNRDRFAAWTRANQIEVYPPREFLKLTLDKHQSHRLVCMFDPTLSPHTEEYAGSCGQLERFFVRGETVFLKPRFGSQGERVIVLTRAANARTLSQYSGQQSTTETWTSSNALHERVSGLVGRADHVIQEGVNVKRHDDCAFIVRVIMLNNGREWSWTHKLVMTPGSGHVANTTQGGLNHTLEDALPRIFGDRDADRVTDELHRVSFDFAAYLDTLYPAMIMEVAYDFLLDAECRVFMAEFDVQPGLMKPGMNIAKPFENLFEIRPEERPIYDRYVLPHARCLAEFFQSKLDQRRAA